MKNIIALIILALMTGIFSHCDMTISAPSNLTVVFTSPSEVTLTWKDNSHNEKGFYVYLKTLPQDKDFVLIKILKTNNITYKDTGIVSGTQYVYKVCSDIMLPETCSNQVEVIGP